MLLGIESFISIVTGFVGFLVVFLIAFSYRSNSLMNIYLIISFGIVSLRLVHSGISGFYEITLLNRVISGITPLLLMGIPSFYLYFQKLYYHKNRFRMRDLLHFIFPIILFVLFLLPVSINSNRSSPITMLILSSIVLYIVLYTVLTIRLIFFQLFENRAEKTAGSSQQILLRKWSTFLGLTASIGSARLLLSLAREIQTEVVAFGYTFSIINSLLWLVTFVMIITHPEILYGYEKLQRYLSSLKEPSKNKQEEPWIISGEVIQNETYAKLQVIIADKLISYFRSIDAYVIAQKPFCNTKYTLKDLGQDLKIPTSHLTYIFKYHSKLSFTEYKNYSRVKYAMELIENGFLESKTFEALADKVGFATYNTFFIAFKEFTGNSPKEFYLEGLQNA